MSHSINIKRSRIIIEKNPSPTKKFIFSDTWIWKLEEAYNDKEIWIEREKGTKNNRKSALRKARQKSDYWKIALFYTPNGRLEEKHYAESRLNVKYSSTPDISSIVTEGSRVA